MRVYEIAKLYGVSSKDIVLLLENSGLPVKSHMSQLDNSALLLIEKHFVKSSSNNNFEKLETKQYQNESQKKIELPREQAKAVVLKTKLTKQQNNITSSHSVPKNKATMYSPIDTPILKQKKDLVFANKTPLVQAHDLTVEQFADQTNISVTQVIVMLLKWGMRVTKNQIIQKETVLKLAQQFNIPVAEVLVKKEQKFQLNNSLKTTKTLQERPPVVVIVGHVDHGKTTLLDFIRKTRVAAREKGGITQHLGAYEVKTNTGMIVFLDTPGHEAFSKIRQRGVRVADIAILVVAADDGVKPQTIEAIKIIQEMETPIIVAINKIDKASESQLELVKQQLLQQGIVSEEWGGETIIVPISAKTGQGIDAFLEMILLQSQMMELRADVESSAIGYVLESKLEKGRGPIATIILQNGCLHKNDYFICGATVGRVTSIVDTYNRILDIVTPSIPVQIAGFEKSPQVGDTIVVISKDAYLQKKTEQRKASFVPQVTSSGVMGEGVHVERFVLKADNNSSREALVDAVEKFFKQQGKHAIIVSSGIGMISESDIELAHNTGAEIFGLHTKMDAKTAAFANQRHVVVHYFDIIYRLLDAMQEKFELQKKVAVERVKIGQATVIKVFNIPKIGEVAGCHINSGKFVKGGFAVAYRGSEKIGESKIVSIQRAKETVTEARAGFECGIVLHDKKIGFQEQDRIECFVEEIKKS